MQVAGEQCREPVRTMKGGPHLWEDHIEHGMKALVIGRPGKLSIPPVPAFAAGPKGPSMTQNPTMREALRRPNTAAEHLPWATPNGR